MDERLTQSDIPLTLHKLTPGCKTPFVKNWKAAVSKFKAEGAAAIVMDVRSGETAMISLPDYDPNRSMNNIPELGHCSTSPPKAFCFGRF